MEKTPVPLPTARDAGIERRIQMKNHGTVLAVLVIYRHGGHEFRAAAQYVSDRGAGRALLPEEATKGREAATEACIAAVCIQVEAYNRAILPPPQLTSSELPCHYSPTLLQSKRTLPSPSTGSSPLRPTPAPTVSA